MNTSNLFAPLTQPKVEVDVQVNPMSVALLAAALIAVIIFAKIIR